jgi:hypothetical protein
LTTDFPVFFAHWVFTYGGIRLFGGPQIVAYSYYLEGFVFLNELFCGSVFISETIFVVVTSFLLGLCL